MPRLFLAGLDNIAQELGCSKMTLSEWISLKSFPALKMGGI